MDQELTAEITRSQGGLITDARVRVPADGGEPVLPGVRFAERVIRCTTGQAATVN